MKAASYFRTTFCLLFSVFLLFNSCKEQEEVKEPAKTSGKFMVWETTATSSKYNISQGISKLAVFINNKYIGYFETKNHWGAEPQCSATGSLTFDFDLGTKESEAIDVEIRNYTTDDILQNGRDTITNGGCAKFEIK